MLQNSWIFTRTVSPKIPLSPNTEISKNDTIAGFMMGESYGALQVTCDNPGTSLSVVLQEKKPEYRIDENDGETVFLENGLDGSGET